MTPFSKILISKVITLPLILALVTSGCSTLHYVKKADKEVYQIIKDAGPLVKNMDPEFSIDKDPVSLENLPTLQPGQVDDYLGEAGEDEIGAYILSLEAALDIAVKNSRDFQSTKENLYRQVLTYTQIRQDYRPVFENGRINGRYTVRNINITKPSEAAKLTNLANSFEQLTGNNTQTLSDYADLVTAAAPFTGADNPEIAIDKDRSVSANTGINVDVLLRGGTRIAAGISANFLRFVTGDSRVSTSSALFAEISKPLLGSNRRDARETILQAERNLLYNLRTFTRARKQFSIGIVNEYYALLQRKNTVLNEWEGYQANDEAFRRATAELEFGKRTPTQVGQSEEAMLSGQNRWINAIQDYNDALDNFKIRLGLPMDSNIVLDTNELNNIMDRGLMAEPKFTVDQSTDIAFANRLDYYTRLDRLDDVARNLEIAGEGLLPNIEVNAGIDVPSMPGDRFQELDFKRYAWDIALGFDPKLNRKGVRNAYRRAVIDYDAEQRDLEEFEDNLRLDLRQSFRSLEQLRFQYEIQKNRVHLSERRIFELELRRDSIGGVSSRDEIEAQADLTAARNTLTRTVVNHTLANLNLWLDMGILYVKENGQWETIPDEPIIQN